MNPDRPFSPSKTPFFYGWIVLGFGSIGMLMSIPGQTVGVSVFTDHLIEALSLSRNSISMAYLVGTVSSALMLSSAGKAYDKYGARLPAIIVTVLLAVTLIYLSSVDYITLGIVKILSNPAPLIRTAIPFTAICIGFFALRFLGQGTLTMFSRNMVMKWFEKKRGMANAVLGITISLGFSIAPRILDEAIAQFGWRGAWRLIAGLLVLFAFMAYLFYRDDPQSAGLEPDGKTAPGHRRRQHIESLPSRDFSLRESKRTFPFWFFNITLALSALIVTAFTFHVISIFQEAGMDRSAAVNIFLPASLIAVTSQFFGSWASDYIKLKYIGFIQLLGILLLSAGILFLGENTGYLLVIAGMGLTQGMMGITSTITWPRFFGLRYLGAVSGYAMAWTVAGSALGPYLFSLAFDAAGSYDFGAILCAGIAFLGILGVFFVKKPA
ncbi:MAG: MFS transporter [Sediminispirochaetaceae bacterium]